MRAVSGNTGQEGSWASENDFDSDKEGFRSPGSILLCFHLGFFLVNTWCSSPCRQDFVAPQSVRSQKQPPPSQSVGWHPTGLPGARLFTMFLQRQMDLDLGCVFCGLQASSSQWRWNCSVLRRYSKNVYWIDFRNSVSRVGQEYLLLDVDRN